MSRTVCLPLIALLAAGACSKPATQAGGAAPQAVAAAPAGTACDRKLVTAADATEILGAPVTEETLKGDAQSCVFTTADFTSMTVSLRPGLGRVSISAWKSGKMNSSVTPVAGVGEEAVWQSTLHEIIAQKNDLLCDIGVIGGGAHPGATPAKLGALCNRIFAAS